MVVVVVVGGLVVVAVVVGGVVVAGGAVVAGGTVVVVVWAPAVPLTAARAPAAMRSTMARRRTWRRMGAPEGRMLRRIRHTVER